MVISLSSSIAKWMHLDYNEMFQQNANKAWDKIYDKIAT